MHDGDLEGGDGSEGERLLAKQEVAGSIPVPRSSAMIQPMASVECAEVWGALAIAQSEIEPPKRTRKARIQSRSGGGYEYSYAPLEEIDRVIRLPLGRQKLMCQQYLVSRGGEWFVRTIIGHASGQWIAGDYPVLVNDNPNRMQAFASGVTYARRYGKCLLLNLAPEDDDDAQATAGEGKPVAAPKEEPGPTEAERAIANGAYQRVRAATKRVQSIPELDRQGYRSLTPEERTLIARLSATAMARLEDEDYARRRELGGG